MQHPNLTIRSPSTGQPAERNGCLALHPQQGVQLRRITQSPVPQPSRPGDDFTFAPVPLWLEDYSDLRVWFDRLRAAGVTDLRAHLTAAPELVAEAVSTIKLVAVNNRTLQMFGAASQEELEAKLDQVLRGEMYVEHVGELVALWDGLTEASSRTVNYTLSGERLEILLHLRVMPGHEQDLARVMVSTVDVTDQVIAERRLAASEQYARGLFAHSPVSLWAEDWQAVKALLDDVRAGGITDFRTFVDVHPEFVERCMAEVRVIDVNEQTLKLLGARDRDHLVANMSQVFRDDIHSSFVDQLIDLWSGGLFQQRETVNYSLTGERVDVYMQFSIMPGHEEDWSLALVSLTDISARKKAEAYLEYLGKHDTLTTLRNRSYFNDEIDRLSRRGPWPVSVLMLDLNGLKTVNDTGGHAQGDALLRRAGEVLIKAAEPGTCAARIGGDEFCVLLPATGPEAAQNAVARLVELVALNNQFYGSPELSFAIGAAICAPGGDIEAAINRADAEMYIDKRRREGSPRR